MINHICGAIVCLTFLVAGSVQAQSITGSGKLLLTGGVSQIEGSAGGGLTPWAVIGGYGSARQIGANAYATDVNTTDFDIRSTGVLIGLYDRVELSYSRQAFNTQDVGTALGLGQDYTINQDTLGVKVKVLGDAVLDQDHWWPQISVGAQFKTNDKAALVTALGARRAKDTDYYVSATKLYLAQGILLNGTLRSTRANQYGILGFGGTDDKRHLQFEASAAYLVNRKLAIGAEVRTKPDNLAIAKEGAAFDIFAAYAATKNISLTLAYADLGHVVTRRQTGLYASLQVGF
jgi:hypothetical protein